MYNDEWGAFIVIEKEFSMTNSSGSDFTTELIQSYNVKYDKCNLFVF